MIRKGLGNERLSKPRTERVEVLSRSGGKARCRKGAMVVVLVVVVSEG